MPLRPRFADFATVAHVLRSARSARIAIALIGIAVLGFAVYGSARRGIEDWQSARWRNDLRMLLLGRAQPSAEQWQRTVDELREALRLAPRDPILWEDLGLAYEAGARSFVPAGGWNAYTEFALVCYRQAAALRPTWPYTWIRVALMKYQLNQLDDEFGRALASAMRLGPWEPGVQIIASDIGLALWDRFDPPFQDQIRENWRRTAVRQPDQLARLAIDYGRAGVLCEVSREALKNRLKCP